VLVCILGFAGLCSAIVMTANKGTWPDTWPKELEQYRDQSRTHDVLAGISEDVHEIPFATRSEFEKAWPHFLKLGSNGTRLILNSPSIYAVSGSEMGPGVRVLAVKNMSSRAPNPDGAPASTPMRVGICSKRM